MTYKRFLQAQSIIVAASSVVFPFYLLFIRNIGESYSQFGWAYGLFTFIAACSYPIVGRLTDRFGEKHLLVTYTWGMAVVMLIIPIVTEIWIIYLIQALLGFLGAIQKTAEKTTISRHLQVEHELPGKTVGTYHFWTTIASAVAIVVTGYIIDFLTIGTIFYLVSIMFFVAGFIIIRDSSVRIKTKKNKPISQ